MRAGDMSGEKFLMLCSTPLSNSEMSLEVIGVDAPLARVATTFRTVEASEEGCARRPAWASNELRRQTAVSRKTSSLHQTRLGPMLTGLFTAAFGLRIGRFGDRQSGHSALV